jgi:hypothetical protein
VIACSEVRVLLGSLPQGAALYQEPLDDVERFLSMMRFDSREKLRDLPFELGDVSGLLSEFFLDIDSSHLV